MNLQLLLDQLRGRVGRADAIRLLSSLVLATLLWGWVTQLEDPEETRTYSNVPVTRGELPAPLQVIAFPAEVLVELKGPESVLEDVLRSDIRIQLDLDGIDEAGTHTVPLEINTPDGVRQRKAIPSEVQIVVDEVTSGQFPLTIKEPPPEQVGNTREIGDIPPPASEVTVTGPRSLVDRVAAVNLPIDIEDRTTGFTGTFEPQAVDGSGIVIPEVQIEPGSFTFFVPIEARGKSVAVIAQVQGEPAPGYEIVDRTRNPQTVLVDGPAEVLANVISVSTTAIDITGATETVSRRVGLEGLPEGVTLVQPQDGQVDVVIQIRQRGVVQPLPSQHVTVIGLGEGLEAAVTPPEISVTVVAGEDVLANLQAGVITVQVDVTGLGPGTYQLTPTISVPPRMQWTEANPTLVTVTISPQPAATPEGSPAASPDDGASSPTPAP